MPPSSYDKIIKDFSRYYNIPVTNLTFEENGKLPILKNSNSDLKGLRNIVSQIPNEQSSELKAIEDQWIEYSLTCGLHSDASVSGRQILKELNDFMVNKVYFVGNNSGPTDVLMYYFLHNLVSNLSFQEKERYLHLCRWFNTIQQNKKVRYGRPEVHFSRTRLYV